jgi:dihydroorotase
LIYTNVNLDGNIVDIKIEDGFVVDIQENIDSIEKIDCNGSYVLPKFVDLNVNVYENSLNSKTLQMISNEAKKGGIGHIVINPTSKPAIDNEIVLEFINSYSHQNDSIKLECSFNTIQEDGNLSNIAIMLKKGAIAPYMNTSTNNNKISKIAQYLQMNNKTLFCRAYDESLNSSGVINDGEVSSKLGLAGISELGEVLHVTKMIEIAKEFDISILFKSIASPRSIELIQKAKDDGLSVFCEVSINHLLFSDKECEDFNTLAKIDPPLVSSKNQEKLLEYLKLGYIDVLTSAHTPFSAVNKEVAFFDAAYGSESIQDIINIYYTKLVKSGIITLERLVEMCVVNPLKMIGQDCTDIKVGSKANFILLDTSSSYNISNTHSLFFNHEMSSQIKTF